MALSFHQAARLKWLKKSLSAMERTRARREVTIQKRMKALTDPVKQIDADIEAVRTEIASLEAKVVAAATDVTTQESGSLEGVSE